MIDRILKATRGRPCSCPSGKICTACTKKRVIPPQVYVEEPKRLPTSVTVSYHKAPGKSYIQAPTVQYVEKPSRWRRKRQKYEPEPKQSPLCKWYKRRKALNQLIAEHKQEEKLLERQRREAYEYERMRELMKWESEREKYKARQPTYETVQYKQVRSKSLPAPKKKEKKVVIKERSASAKPVAKSKYVASKKFSTKESITRRFVNYCYRLCCQFYCCLTCILIVVFAVIFIF